jgi:hypothetical protein
MMALLHIVLVRIAADGDVSLSPRLRRCGDSSGGVLFAAATSGYATYVRRLRVGPDSHLINTNKCHQSGLTI